MEIEHGSDEQVVELDSLDSTDSSPEDSKEQEEQKEHSPTDFEAQRQLLTLSFQDLTYSVKVLTGSMLKRIFLCSRNEVETKVLLHGVSGSFTSGQVVAIMGSSGAGKTTLLNVLARRATGKVSGDMFVNGKKLSRKKLRLISAYVMQDDILLGHLTPREYLRFHARLRLPREMPLKAKMAAVESIIEELGLQSCANTRIGMVGQTRGISGGERRRVSIALELVTNPQIIFMDEPTSGLDSTTALALMHTLLRLAQKGRTIITTIHQPSSEIYETFDKLFLMHEGQVVYFGDASKAVAYFTDIGYSCPVNYNPADYFLRLLMSERYTFDKKKSKLSIPDEEAPQESSSADKTSAQPVRNVRARTSTRLLDAYQQRKQSIPEPEEVAMDSEEIRKPRPGANPMAQFLLLLHRTFLITIREPMKTIVKLVQAILLALFAGFVYFQLGDDQKSIQSREGVLFFVCLNMAMSSLMGYLVIFPRERVVFIREHANGCYRSVPYYLARTLIDLPFDTFLPVLYTLIAYWMIELKNTPGAFFIFLSACLLATHAAASIGLCLGAAFDDPGIAISLTPLFLIPFMVFGGFLVNLDTAPAFLSWIKYISFFRYAFEVIVVNEFQGRNFTCTPEQLIANSSCPIPNGDAVINNLGFENVVIWQNMLILVAMIVGFRLVGFFVLKFSVWRKTGE